MFSTNKDANRIILQNLDDSDLFHTLLVNKYANFLGNEDFFRNRLITKYPSTAIYKPTEQSWKKYYLSVIYYIDKMKTEYDFEFTIGDPKVYYKLLRKNFKTNKRTVKIKENLIKNYEDLALYFTNKDILNYNFMTGFNNKLYSLNTLRWDNHKANYLKGILEYT